MFEVVANEMNLNQVTFLNRIRTQHKRLFATILFNLCMSFHSNLQFSQILITYKCTSAGKGFTRTHMNGMKYRYDISSTAEIPSPFKRSVCIIDNYGENGCYSVVRTAPHEGYCLQTFQIVCNTLRNTYVWFKTNPQNIKISTLIMSRCKRDNKLCAPKPALAAAVVGWVIHEHGWYVFCMDACAIFRFFIKLFTHSAAAQQPL